MMPHREECEPGRPVHCHPRCRAWPTDRTRQDHYLKHNEMSKQQGMGGNRTINIIEYKRTQSFYMEHDADVSRPDNYREGEDTDYLLPNFSCFLRGRSETLSDRSLHCDLPVPDGKCPSRKELV